MNNIIEKCKTTRILALIGIIGLILGSILPYIKYESWLYDISISLLDCWEGKVTLILAIANLLFIFKDFVEKYIPALFNSSLGQKIYNCSNPKYSLIPTVLAAIFIIYLTFSLSEYLSLSNYGIGFYITWLSIICLIAYAFLHKDSIDTDNINTTE